MFNEKKSEFIFSAGVDRIRTSGRRLAEVMTMKGVISRTIERKRGGFAQAHWTPHQVGYGCPHSTLHPIHI
jgi:hypothetical protein